MWRKRLRVTWALPIQDAPSRGRALITDRFCSPPKLIPQNAQLAKSRHAWAHDGFRCYFTTLRIFRRQFEHLHLTSPLAVISSVTSACSCLEVSEVNQRPLSKSSKLSALYRAGFPAVHH